ncbi:MAG: hypothetical protein ACYTX0_39335, partial [Nostoc sp.]
SILFANKITLYLNIIFSDGYARRRHRTFFESPNKIALLPTHTMTNPENLSERRNGEIVR